MPNVKGMSDRKCQIDVRLQRTNLCLMANVIWIEADSCQTYVRWQRSNANVKRMSDGKYHMDVKWYMSKIMSHGSGSSNLFSKKNYRSKHIIRHSIYEQNLERYVRLTKALQIRPIAPIKCRILCSKHSVIVVSSMALPIIS